MALALYRTYRPGTLADVVGQEHVTEPLGRALDADRMHHAYLLSGPRGCGKTSTARILARSLNCEQGPTSTPCGTCPSCVDLAPNGPGSIDVIELDAATHRGIDDARDLREKAIYAPAASRYRVYIIDEAHQLTPEASNALLKLIEEPPAHLRFIFATTEPDKIIATIRSRTFHYPFRLVPARILIDHLARVCAAEGVAAEQAALAVVARAGAGSVRDSLSVLGQLLSGAGPEGLTHADAAAALGLTDDALIDGFVEALSAGSVAAMLGVVDGVISAGHDPRSFVADVLDRLRDLIILRADPGALETGLIDVPDDAGRRLLTQSESLGLTELSHAADLVSAGLSEVRGATAPRLQLELLCARLALHHPVDDLTSVLARLERLERGMAAGGSVAAAPAPARGASQDAGTDGSGAGSLPPTPEAGSAGRDAQQAEVVAAPSTSAETSTATAEGGDSGQRAAPPRGSTRSASGPPRRPTLRSGRVSATDPNAAGTADPAADGADAAAVSSPELAPESSSSTGNDSRSTAVDPQRSVVSSRADVGAASGRADAESTGRDSSSTASAPASRSATSPPAVTSATSADASDSSPGATGTAPDARSSSQLARVTQAWPSVLDRLAQGSRVAWTIFEGARPLTLSEGTLAVAVPDAGKVAAITQRGHDVRLREALLAVLELDVTIDVIHDGGANSPSSGTSGPTASPAPEIPGAGRGARGASAPRRAPVTGRAERPGTTRVAPVEGSAIPSGSAVPDPSRPPLGAPPLGASRPVPAASAEQRSAPVGPPTARWARPPIAADAPPDEPDEPSDDDPDVDEIDGLALVTRELGARTISQIDHT